MTCFFSLPAEYDDTLDRTSDSAGMRASIQYPDSLEGTGNYAQYAQTLEAMFTQSENDLDAKRKTGKFSKVIDNH